jgi:flagellar assembly protein FliH
MSSRLLDPDDPRRVEAVIWRRVCSAADPPEVPDETAPAPRFDPAELEREWQGRVSEARAAGRREGEAAARKQAMAELQAALERLARSVDEIAGLRSRLRREAEADLVQLAIAIARRVIRRELAVDPDALHGLVLGALERLQTQEINRVRVHSAHAGIVAALLRDRAGGSEIEVVPDPSAEPGAAFFETDRGTLDASVESQLSEIERGLADTLRRQR